MDNYFKKAFTLGEALISIVLLGFIAYITISNITTLVPDTNKGKFKKAYGNLETGISKLFEHTAIYESDFSQIDVVTLKDTGEAFGLEGPKAKFRESLAFILSATEDGINCPMYNNLSPQNRCIRTDDGVVFGIPDTDFKSTGIVSEDNDIYVPISIYTTFNTNSTLDDAFIVGINRYGKIKLLKQTDCESTNKSNRCKAQQFLLDASLKRDLSQ